jgi:hypothetical protein
MSAMARPEADLLVAVYRLDGQPYLSAHALRRRSNGSEPSKD